MVTSDQGATGAEPELSDDPPGYLEVPPVSGVEQLGLPVTTMVQGLPLEKLVWEDFERLCLRLVRTRAEVRQCARYGRPGQDQQGIDLFAERLDGTYATYQCKRVEHLTPADLNALTSRFLAGRWAATSDAFVLCTTRRLDDVALQGAIVVLTRELREHGIRFEAWGPDALALELKDQPLLVYDFFGVEWARHFCGDERIAGLVARLGPADLRVLRDRLAKFYTALFREYDPEQAAGQPLGSIGLSLSARFVAPDVIEQREVFASVGGLTNERDEDPLVATHYPDQIDVLASPPVPASNVLLAEEIERRRLPAMVWLADGDARIVLGGPGSGKSTLLRVAALDLLSEAPRFPALAARWGTFIPVWVPFSLWTQVIDTEPGHDWSLANLVERWLLRCGVPDLWPLVKEGLNDERVLLLVDGLDEFDDLTSADQAFMLLSLHVELRSCPILAAGRDHAFGQLEVARTRWPTAALAPLSDTQQQTLARCWIEAAADEGASVGADRVEEFMNELHGRTELAELAGVPLLLVHLVHLWLARWELPSSRVGTHERIVDLLLSSHPARRRRASALESGSEELTTDELLRTVSHLALELQTIGRPNITDDDAVARIIAFLRDEEHGIGLEKGAARRVGLDTFKRLEDRLGILVRVTPHDVAFFHASIREYLAARAMARLATSDQVHHIHQYGTLIQWREVIANLICLARADDAETIVTELAQLRNKDPSAFHLDIILANAAVSESELPPRRRRSELAAAIKRVDENPWLPHRDELVRAVVQGLRSPVVARDAEGAVGRWFPARSGWLPQGFGVLARWSQDGAMTDCLMHGLRQSDADAAVAAARTLAELGLLETTRDELVALATSYPEPLGQAAALLALGTSCPTDHRARRPLDAARTSGAPELRLVAIHAAVLAGMTPPPEDLAWLLTVAGHDSGLETVWLGLVLQTLVHGWGGTEKLRDRLIAVERENRNRYRSHGVVGPDRDFALMALLRGFPDDPVVSEVLAAEIDEEHPFLGFMLHLEPWVLLARNFRDDPALVPAIDRWLQRQNSAHIVEMRYAALVGRTAVAKDILLHQLADPFPFWAAEALLDGWGMTEPDVAERLTAASYAPAASAGFFAHLVPRILAEPEEARRRLVALLADPDNVRPEFALMGLTELGVPVGDDVVADTALARLHSDDHGTQLLPNILRHLSWDPRVRPLAVTEMAAPGGEWAAVGFGFSHDPELRALFLGTLGPLPTAGRAAVVATLGAASPKHRHELLARYDNEENIQIRTDAAVLHARTQDPDPASRKALRDRLRNDLVRGGIDHETVAQVAFAVALALDMPDVLLEARSNWGDDQRVKVQVWDFYRSNTPLLRLVLSNWDRLKDLFGAEFWFRLNIDDSTRLHAWQAFCTIADEFPRPRADAMEFLRAQSHRNATPQILAFLARVQPRGDLLRDYCIATVTHDGDSMGDWQAAEFAAEVAGRHFGGDQDFHDALEASLPPAPPFPGAARYITVGAICALSEGWPQSPLLDAAWQLRQAHQLPLTEGAIAHLVCVRGSEGEVVESIRLWAASASRCDTPSLRARRRALRRRVDNDPDLTGRLITLLLSDDATASEQVSLAGLLFSGQPSDRDPQIAAWATDTHRQQWGPNIPSIIGYDVSTGRFRSLRSVLANLSYASTPGPN